MVSLTHTRGGYIALIAVVIMSLLLSAFVMSINMGSFLLRFNTLDSEAKGVSEALSAACANFAILILIEDPLFEGEKEIPVDQNICAIGQIEKQGNSIKFETKAKYKKAHTRYYIVLDSYDLSIISWREI